jgi:hypothetical protein
MWYRTYTRELPSFFPSLYYDRRSVGQSVLVSSPHLGLKTRYLLLSDNCGFVDIGRPLWREDGPVFYNCCCLRQRSHCQVRVPRGSWPRFTVSDLRLPHPGGPGHCIYIPQELSGPVIPPGTAFHKGTTSAAVLSRSHPDCIYNISCYPSFPGFQSNHFPGYAYCYCWNAVCFVAVGTCSPGRCLANDVCYSEIGRCLT